MTDPRNAQPGSYGTSGYGAGAGEESRMAVNSGKASVGPRWPGAASPAGWFPPPAGEAAPPVRHREPARSDGASPYAAGYSASEYAVETRPTSMYLVPWQTARQERLRRSLGRLQAPKTRSAPAAPAGRTCAGRRSPAAARGTSPWSAPRRRCAAGPAAPGPTCPRARSPACSTRSGSPAGSSRSAYGGNPASTGKTRPGPPNGTRRPIPTRPSRTRPTRTGPPRSRTRTCPTITRTTSTTT